MQALWGPGAGCLPGAPGTPQPGSLPMGPPGGLCGAGGRWCPLEVERQVCGDDGDVHEVDHVLMLPPVQVLIDVQGLQVGLWSQVRLPHPPVRSPPPPLLEVIRLSLLALLASFYPRVMGPRPRWLYIAPGGPQPPFCPPTLRGPEPTPPPVGAFPNWNHQACPITPMATTTKPASLLQRQSCVVWAPAVGCQGCGRRSVARKSSRRGKGGHRPPRRAGTSRTPGGVVPKSRSHGAWLKGPGICYRGLVKNKQWSEAPEQPVCPQLPPRGRGTPAGAAGHHQG